MNRKEYQSEPAAYTFQRDNETIEGTVQVILTEEDGSILNVEVLVTGDTVTQEVQASADALAARICQEGVDALSGATPTEAIEAVQKAVAQCMQQIEQADSDTSLQGWSEKGPEETDEKEIVSTLFETPPPDSQEPFSSLPLILTGLALGVLVGAAAMYFFQKLCAKKRPQVFVEDTNESEWVNKVSGQNKPEEPPYDETESEAAKPLRIGKLHNIGARPGQQDSFGTALIPGGVLAVVADGMGGLADGDKVSQTIVRTMLADAAQLGRGNNHQKLYTLAAHANQAVLSMLGPSRRYQSGSTLISVLIQEGWLQWLSIGDSRIYLYRAGRLFQLNREHVLEQEMLVDIVNNRRTLSQVYQNGKRKGLTSFIGMGELKYVDASPRPMRLQVGDKVLLMSDGVFNTLSETEIEAILTNKPDVVQAAAVLEQSVLARNNPKQDNFTAVLLGL